MTTISVYTTCNPFESMELAYVSWAWLHLDFAVPFLGWMFLIQIDTHFLWTEICETASATSTVVMQEFRTTFARFGLLETFIIDIGMCFVSY